MGLARLENTGKPALILASGSPRRAALLSEVGYTFDIVRPDIDETIRPDEDPQAYARRMSDEKFAASTATVSPENTSIYLAADTIVVLDQHILGKPENRQAGIEMLTALSGRSHRVLTSVTLGRLTAKRQFEVETIVDFRTLTLDECAAYWDTGEPADKAGGYGAQGVGGIFVAAYHGSYTNVVGLPMMETTQALAEFGMSIL